MEATMEKPRTNGHAAATTRDTRPRPVQQAEQLRARLAEWEAKEEQHAAQAEFLLAEIGIFEDDAFEAVAAGDGAAETKAREKIAAATAAIEQHEKDRLYARRVVSVLQERAKDAAKAEETAMRVVHRQEVAPLVEELGRHLAAAHLANRKLFRRLYELQGGPGFPGWLEFSVDVLGLDPGKSGARSASPGLYNAWLEHVTGLGFDVEVPPRPE